MNIKEAKEQIKNAMVSYFTKDENGEYVIPTEKQRPVFLMGPPGIGKTAIMEQIASEMGVGLLSYSMTHHTRQSALGLPFIKHKTYGGKEYDISEYTMSEIIASVYDLMEETGIKEGILFLDEINCVSETLSPIMLQFLQYKVFGRHTVPDGWIVVTAGNPPEYNNSVKEFDIVTWDRLKRIDIEPDYKVWKEYAYNKNVHPSILTYLDIKNSDFYIVESTVDGKSFITARGWDDLSTMIWLYEKNNLTVDIKLVEQYVQNKRVAKDFSIYYDLFNKYKSDYQVDKILEGKVTSDIKTRAKKAKFDERLSLIGLLLGKINEESEKSILYEDVLKELNTSLKQIKKDILANKDPKECLDAAIDNKNELLSSGSKAKSITKEYKYVLKQNIKIINHLKELVFDVKDGKKAFEIIKKEYDLEVKNMKDLTKNTKVMYSNMFKFLEEVYKEGQELLIVVTELTINTNTVLFISRFGCDEYFKHNKDLLINDRQKEIEEEIKNLNLE